jgi:hypothetical protein
MREKLSSGWSPQASIPSLVEKTPYLKTDSEAKQEARVLNPWTWEGVGGEGKRRKGDMEEADEKQE